MFKHDYTQKVRCSFCGMNGHNIRSCPEVPTAANDEENATYDEYQVAKAKAELQKRAVRKHKKLTTKRKPPSCGFCKAKSHNRKNCKRMSKFRKKLYKANTKWRRHFAERIRVLGVGTGAIIEASGVPVNVLSRSNVPVYKNTHVGMVNVYDYDSLNVFCNFAGAYDYRSDADITAKLITAGGMLDISIGKYIGEDLFHKNAFFPHYSRLKVINPKPIECSNEWINEKSIPVLDWLPQTHDYEELHLLGIVRFIEDWTKNVLDNTEE